MRGLDSSGELIKSRRILLRNLPSIIDLMGFYVFAMLNVRNLFIYLIV